MDPQAQNNSSVPYIGSKISLISNVDIRYEGVLYSINTFESTVALQNVRSLGTEGRRQPEIPPSNRTYQFIVFKGKDIKDLTVCEPAAGRMPDDPAVVSVNVAPTTSVGVSQNQMSSPMQRGPMQPTGADMTGYGMRGIYGMGGGQRMGGRPVQPVMFGGPQPHMGQMRGGGHSGYGMMNQGMMNSRGGRGGGFGPMGGSYMDPMGGMGRGGRYGGGGGRGGMGGMRQGG
eukprot:CAMPEP_0113857616 /NCGR_PEP_ID=MMETSP0372-20130328/10391_1 /TAXON_ID=340204 /ORGANISM="Lankesteria abbotti" /LENGTH=229 /DNA_ID=CAMNT_0000833749 /DNA_START=68 /DNA_END=754 /DNA_ORIENTATION=- /assembly_acc=CAM_ASM_000359